jgi:branched-chain amino acid transport system substrate-binding protein
MVTPSATTPELTAQQAKADWKGPRVVFRVCPTDDVEGAFAATYALRRLSKPRVAIVHDGTPYGEGLAEQFRKTYARGGGRVIGDAPIESGQRDFKSLLGQIEALKPGAIYFGGVYTEAGLIVSQMRALGMKAVFISGDGAKTPGFFDVAGDAADDAYITTVGIPVELIAGARGFLEDYRRRWIGEDEGVRPFDHYGFEAAQIVFDALDRLGQARRYDREGLIGALRQTRHEGLLGVTRFDPKGDTLNKIITMTRARAKDRSFPAAP